MKLLCGAREGTKSLFVLEMAKDIRLHYNRSVDNLSIEELRSSDERRSLNETICLMIGICIEMEHGGRWAAQIDTSLCGRLLSARIRYYEYGMIPVR